MTAVADRSFMSNFCDPNLPQIAKPWSVDGFDCASTPHALLMMPGETFGASKEAPPLDSILGTELTVAARGVSFARLQGWSLIGPPLHRRCFECGVEGESAEQKPGMLCGRVLNRLLLRECLLYLSANTVDISIGKELDPVLIECPAGWKLYLMPLKLAEGDSYEFPLEAAALYSVASVVGQ